MDLPISRKNDSNELAQLFDCKRPNFRFHLIHVHTEGGRLLLELEFSIVKAENSFDGRLSFFVWKEAINWHADSVQRSRRCIYFATNSGRKRRGFYLHRHGYCAVSEPNDLGYLQSKVIPHRAEVHLIFGARYEHDILFREEFEFFEKNLPNFKFDVALSRQNQLIGQVIKDMSSDIYTEGYQNVRSDVDFYICGWSNMIDDAVAKLIVDLGYDKSQVHYELYG